MEMVDLVKSVPNVPTYEEYFGINDNLIEDDEFEVDNKDENIKKMILIMLGLLQEFYIQHMYDGAYYYDSEQFEEDIKEFNSELKDNLLILFSSYLSTLATEYDAYWRIPTDTVELELELDDIVDTGIDAVTNTLYSDLKDTAKFYTVLAWTSGVFSPHGNFRRAIRKLTNEVDFKGQHIRKIVKRKYDEFVYGQDALFTWRCSGRNTCAWCYTIEAMGAMPLSWFPLDHPNGECELVAVNPDKYSDEYNLIIKA